MPVLRTDPVLPPFGEYWKMEKYKKEKELAGI